MRQNYSCCKVIYMGDACGPENVCNTCMKTVHVGSMDRGFTVYVHSPYIFMVWYLIRNQGQLHLYQRLLWRYSWNRDFSIVCLIKVFFLLSNSIPVISVCALFNIIHMTWLRSFLVKYNVSVLVIWIYFVWKLTYITVDSNCVW